MTEISNLSYFALYCLLLGYFRTTPISNELFPTNATVFEYESVTIAFSFKIQENVTFIWTQLNTNGSIIVEYTHPSNNCTSRNVVFDKNKYKAGCNMSTASLTILNVKRNESGQTWSCRKIQNSTIMSTATLTVYVPVEVVSIVTANETVLNSINKTVIEIVCTTTPCRPRPTVKLLTKTSRNETVQIGHQDFKEKDDTEVKIYNVSFSFLLNKTVNGWHIYCEASNRINFALSRKSEDVVLNVLYPPDIPPHIEEILSGSIYNIIEFHYLNLTCKAIGGNPLAQLIWIADGSTLQEQNVIRSSETVANAISLFVNTRENKTLECRSVHVTKNESVKVHVNVMYPPENMRVTIAGKSFPRSNLTSNFNVTENTDLTFECVASANPYPSKYIWSGITTLNSPQLELKTTKENDGEIKCQAINEMSQSNGKETVYGRTETTFSVGVLYPPELIDNVTLSPKAGGEVNFDCIQKQGKTTFQSLSVLKNEITIVRNDRLLIRNVSRNDSGRYVCKLEYSMIPTYGYATNYSMEAEFYIDVRYEDEIGQEEHFAESTVGAVVGGVIGGLLVILAVVAGLLFIRKRRFFRKTPEKEENHEYQNITFEQEPIKIRRAPAAPPPEGDPVKVYQNICTQDLQETAENDYYNTSKLIDDIKTVKITELLSFVTSKTIEDFHDEFNKFPKGMSPEIPYRTARNPDYVAMNRFQGIYPYDHSRVVIEKPDFFINANYIDGFGKRRVYIASLGPTTKHTRGFTTFWDMVWYEQSDVIVMLTNLVEPSGMKCEKYWADSGTSRNIGDYIIQSHGEDVTAEYTVRKLTMSKDGKSRSITQLHYTAWPDKTVPESVTSLIEFRQRVKSTPTRLLGPLIVHCSAGIGRTGTYIGLDRLIDEGKSTDSVNVYDCVMNMRKQRVNMVQTPEQYVYLHQTLVYCLAFDIEPVTADKIDEYIQTASNNVFSQIYQQLGQRVEKEPVDERDARTKNSDLFDMNRLKSDIPGDAHRVRVYMDKEFGESDYINAVYLSGFLSLEHFIIAQSPLPDTLEDFVIMLYQEKSCCIVCLDDCQQTQTNKASCVPCEDQRSVFGYVSVSCFSVEMKTNYIKRKLVIKHAGKHESGERIVFHYEYCGWKHDESLPKDPEAFMKFVREVDQQTNKIADAKSHVVVHCMTGSERSGLFCAVSNLIQKMELEHQVSVVNTLRRVRERRQTAIPIMEQLKFCYQAVDAFVKTDRIGQKRTL